MPSEKSMNSRKPARRLVLVTPASTNMQSLPPLFLTTELRRAIERLLPVGHHLRLRHYFDTYGCLRCSRNRAIYGANGFCMPCLQTIRKRMRKVDKELQARKPAPPPTVEETYLRSYSCARNLLADLRSAIRRKPIREKLGFKSPPQVYLKL